MGANVSPGREFASIAQQVHQHLPYEVVVGDDGRGLDVVIYLEGILQVCSNQKNFEPIVKTDTLKT